MTNIIRQLTFLAALAGFMLCLGACTATVYNEPQPPGKPVLKAIPSSLQGSYISRVGDTLMVSRDGFVEVRAGKKDEPFLIRDSMQVKKFAGYWFFNMLTDNGYWMLYLVKSQGDALVLSALDAKECLHRLRQICTVQEVMKDDGSLDYYLLNPTKKEWRKILRENLAQPTDTLRALQ